MGHPEHKQDSDNIISFNDAATAQDVDKRSMESILTLVHSRDIADPIRAAVEEALPEIWQAITNKIDAKINGSLPRDAKTALIAMAQQIATDRSSIAAQAITDGIIDSVKNASKNAMANAQTAIQKAKRPVMIFGSNVLIETYNPLFAVMQRTDIPFMCTSKNVEKAVYETPVCKSYFPNGYIGIIGDKADILSKADCIILVGDNGEHRDYYTVIAPDASVVSFDTKEHAIRVRRSNDVFNVMCKDGNDVVNKLSNVYQPWETRMANAQWKKVLGKTSRHFPAHAIR